VSRHEHITREVEPDGHAAILDRHPLAMVYGGGGAFGIGYAAGVAHGLADGGIPVAASPALGTSAGSWVASVVALGLSYDVVASLEPPSVPNLRPGRLAGLAREIFGESRHPLVSVAAVSVRTGRRHILSGDRHSLADLVAASSAVPGLLAPHRVDGRLYVDGGVWSTTSVDAAAHAESVIVVAPLAGPHMGLMGRGAGILLERELRTWRRRHPTRSITMIRPNRESAAFAGSGPLSLFDGGRARAVYSPAYEQGRVWAERLSLAATA
jgi:NTE family protein